MRAYFFCNFYLSNIQKGIQSAHCIVDLIYKYRESSSDFRLQINHWCIEHKTMILLNGGNQESLFDLFTFLISPENPYPFEKFHEDGPSLNGALTCVGIILPEKIYEGAALLRNRNNTVGQLNDFQNIIIPVDGVFNYLFTDWELELMKKLNEYRLA